MARVPYREAAELIELACRIISLSETDPTHSRAVDLPRQRAADDGEACFRLADEVAAHEPLRLAHVASNLLGRLDEWFIEHDLHGDIRFSKESVRSGGGLMRTDLGSRSGLMLA